MIHKMHNTQIPKSKIKIFIIAYPCSSFIFCCFYSKMTELSSYDKWYELQSQKYLLSDSLWKKFDDSYFRLLVCDSLLIKTRPSIKCFDLCLSYWEAACLSSTSGQSLRMSGPQAAPKDEVFIKLVWNYCNLEFSTMRINTFSLILNELKLVFVACSQRNLTDKVIWKKSCSRGGGNRIN